MNLCLYTHILICGISKKHKRYRSELIKIDTPNLTKIIALFDEYLKQPEKYFNPLFDQLVIARDFAGSKIIKDTLAKLPQGKEFRMIIGQQHFFRVIELLK